MTEPTGDNNTAIQRQIPSTNCIDCGYTLTGLADSSRCPECGREFGNELVLLGFKQAQGNASPVFYGAAALLVIGIASSIFIGTFSCCGLPLIAGAIALAINGYRMHRSLKSIGGDLRWIIDQEGIRTIRFTNTAIQLLPWTQVNEICIRSSLGFRARKWRALRLRRQLLSMDFWRTRGQSIWFEKATRTEMDEWRDRILEFRDKGPATQASERIGP